MGATIAMIGVVSGPSLEFALPLIIMNLLHVVGLTCGSRRQFADMLRTIGRHAIKPVIDKTFPLQELPAALARLQTGGHVGKICIEMG